jgi:integrase/recombinase XerC
MVEKFIQYLQHEKRFSAHTLSAYTVDLSQFSDYIQEIYSLTSLLEVGHSHIRSWIVALMDANISPRSINRKLSTLKSFYKFCRTRGFLHENPMLKVIAPKVGKRLPHYVSEQSMDLLESSIPYEAGFSGIRNKCMIELLYGTGIRESELMQLKLKDIDHSARLIKVLGKGKKERIVPLHPDLYTTIEAYIIQRNATHYNIPEKHDLFLTDKGESLYPKLVYNIVKRYLSYVTTIEQRSPHVLRHTFATHLSNNGADIKAIKELLGHSSLAATQVYTHNSIERLRQVYEQAFPRAEEQVISEVI